MPVFRLCCAVSATANCGRNFRARIAWAQLRRTMPRRVLSMTRSSPPIRVTWYGAPTGRTRDRRGPRPTQGDCATYSSTGHHPPTGRRSSSTIPRAFTTFRTDKSPVRPAPLFHLDVRGLNDFRPFRDLGADTLGKLLRGAGDRLEPQRFELPGGFRLRHRLADLAVEHGND